MRIVGDVVGETDVSSLGLSAQVTLTADSLRNVTGPSTAVAQNSGDAGSDLNESWFSGANLAETTASGLQTLSDVRHCCGWCGSGCTLHLYTVYSMLACLYLSCNDLEYFHVVQVLRP